MTRPFVAGPVDLFFAIFGHHPVWLKIVLLARHRMGALFGLDAANAAEVLRPTRAASYRLGQKIGPWPIYVLSEHELVAGRDNKHLDFRLAVLKRANGNGAFAVVSTVCCAHNRFGRAYLRAISPFHTWGVRRLLSRASAAGRL